MASTIQISQTVSWASPFVRFRPLTLGTNSEPAMSSASLILQTILGAPFAWPWNRASTTFTTTAGQQDYVVSAPGFGWLEMACCNLAGSAAPNTFEIPNIKNILGMATEQGRPHSIAKQLDNDAGSLTFRLLPVPDQAYTITLIYQIAAPLVASLIQTWAPLPDYMQYIAGWGFLALMQLYSDDMRFQMSNQKFVATLLAAAEGVEEEDRMLFVGDWNAYTNSLSMRREQGVQALGSI